MMSFDWPVANRSSILLADQSPNFVALSDDCSVVAFASQSAVSQIFVARSDGTGRWQITDFPGGVYPAAMSGDGKVVFATTYSTSAYRLVRIDVATGRTACG